MSTYNVSFTYDLPEWGDITLDAKDAEEASELALDQIEALYPEALNVDITKVKEIQLHG
jgi:hypothetical protein